MPIPKKRNVLAPLEEVLDEGFSAIHTEDEEEIEDNTFFEEEENEEYILQEDDLGVDSTVEYAPENILLDENEEDDLEIEEEPVLSNPLQDYLSMLTQNSLFKPILIGVLSLIIVIVLSTSVYFLFFRGSSNHNTTTENGEQTENIVNSKESSSKDTYGANLVLSNVHFDITEGVTATLQFDQDVEGQLYTIFREQEQGKFVACSSEENSFSADLRKEITLECTRKMREGYALADQYFISSQGNEINKKGE